MAGSTTNPNNDLALSNVPQDSISSLAFSRHPADEAILACGSWDSTIRCWRTTDLGNGGQFLSTTNCDEPVLSVAINSESNRVYAGSCDGSVICWDLKTDTKSVVGLHESPVRSVKTSQNLGPECIVSGGWDKMLRIWDTRAGAQIAHVPLPERCYDMDVRENSFISIMAERNIITGDIRNTDKVVPVFAVLKHQLRCVAYSPTANAFIIGGTDGRCSVNFTDSSSNSFSFKCHREDTQCYSVNAVTFSESHNTFATAGADGGYAFWDHNSRQRLRSSSKCNQTLSAAAMHHEGTLFAYAASYDWSRGISGYDPSGERNVFIRNVVTREIEPRERRR